jgi:hypothetical protein
MATPPAAGTPRLPKLREPNVRYRLKAFPELKALFRAAARCEAPLHQPPLQAEPSPPETSGSVRAAPGQLPPEVTAPPSAATSYSCPTPDISRATFWNAGSRVRPSSLERAKASGLFPPT